MPRFLPVGKGVKGAAGFLLGAIPALGAVLTALAITGGLAGRMARDHPLATYSAFALAVLAIFAGAVAAFALREGSAEERIAVHAGLGLVGASLLFGVYAGVLTWGDRAQPSIMLTPKPDHTVAVTVRGEGLRSRDHIVVEVEQLVRATTDSGGLTWRAGEPLYGASLGPDGDGVIEYTVDIPLPAGDYDDLGARAWVGDEPKPCYASGNTTGCVRVHVPRPQERPQLAVSWETFVRAPRLALRVTARNQPPRPARTMTLRSSASRPTATGAASPNGRSRRTPTVTSTAGSPSSSATRSRTCASSRARRRGTRRALRRSMPRPSGHGSPCRLRDP